MLHPAPQKASTLLRIRPATRASLDRLADRHGLTLVELARRIVADFEQRTTEQQSAALLEALNT